MGKLNNYILHKESINDYDIKIMRLDYSDSVELEFSKNNKIIVKKRMEDLDAAKKFLNKIKNKFRNNDKNKKFNLKKKKEARINSDDPKAFSRNSPSEYPFMNSGPGGLLSHIELKKRQYDRNKDNRTRGRKKWHSTEGGEKKDDYQLSRWGPESGPSRDDGSDRPGFKQITNEEGYRPPIPKGEDSIDLAKNPDEYNPIYDY
ncbi:MAG: hypothetical protein ACOCUI_00655, partial [bacterium]